MSEASVFTPGIIVGVLRARSASIAYEQAVAAFEAGLSTVEVTFTVPDAHEVIRALRRVVSGKSSVGAGTILTVAQAEAAIEAGAEYLVSPHLGVRIAEAAAAAGCPYVPGVSTPTEVCAAHEAGLSVVKLFPIARLGGTAYLGDLLGPFPDLRAMVTGGVTAEDVSAYFAAGATAVALGSVFGPTTAETRERVVALLRDRETTEK